MNGRISGLPTGANISYYFEYSTSANATTWDTTPTEIAVIPGPGFEPLLSAVVSNLTQGAYYYRLVGIYSGLPVYGNDRGPVILQVSSSAW